MAAFCWCGGLLIFAFGIHMHQLWIMWLGSGVIGGIGLGLGYISPVSTLIKWFPDRRGMATGLAIMGFGGGAMIGAPLADKLMKHFATATSVGAVRPSWCWRRYFVFMMGGALGYRVTPEDWKPAGWNPDTVKKALVTRSGPSERGLAHAAVLADLARADAERFGRYRHPEPGFPDRCRRSSAGA